VPLNPRSGALLITTPRSLSSARILSAISSVETFIKDSRGMDILEIFELIGNAEVAIAGVEAST